MKKKGKATNRQSDPQGSPMPKTAQELLTDALVLGLTAPSDDAVDRAVALAERVACACSEWEVFAAKRDALFRVRMLKEAQ